MHFPDGNLGVFVVSAQLSDLCRLIVMDSLAEAQQTQSLTVSPISDKPEGIQLSVYPRCLWSLSFSISMPEANAQIRILSMGYRKGLIRYQNKSSTEHYNLVMGMLEKHYGFITSITSCSEGIHYNLITICQQAYVRHYEVLCMLQNLIEVTKEEQNNMVSALLHEKVDAKCFIPLI